MEGVAHLAAERGLRQPDCAPLRGKAESDLTFALGDAVADIDDTGVGVETFGQFARGGLERRVVPSLRQQRQDRLAARLEGANKLYGTSVLVTNWVVAAAGEGG